MIVKCFGEYERKKRTQKTGAFLRVRMMRSDFSNNKNIGTAIDGIQVQIQVIFCTEKLDK